MAADAADPDRRTILKIATCTLGGAAGLAVAAPALRLFVDPVGKQTVTTPRDPIDIGPWQRYLPGAPPLRVELVAPVIRDGWSAARDVVLGAAWVRRTGDAPGAIDARSAICPHLGCAVTWDVPGQSYLCPCHDSRFSLAGEKLTGPSERGLDVLPVQLVDGRLKLTWVQYKLGQTTAEPV